MTLLLCNCSTLADTSAGGSADWVGRCTFFVRAVEGVDVLLVSLICESRCVLLVLLLSYSAFLLLHGLLCRIDFELLVTLRFHWVVVTLSARFGKGLPIDQ